MKKYGLKRLTAAFLTAMLLLCMLPQRVLAEERRSFCLVVETSSRLVVAPERIFYTEGQTIRQALQASGHSFLGIENNMITAVDGVTGNFTRSDENGGYDLDAQASAIQVFRISEQENSHPSVSLQGLIRVMAGYLEEESDVRAAAKQAYDAACAGFCGATDQQAQTFTGEIETAIAAYRSILNGTQYAVRFSDGTNLYGTAAYAGVQILAENSYGKQYSDEDSDGILFLPAGGYHFSIRWNGCRIAGDLLVNENTQVTAAMPVGEWINAEKLELSGGYDGDFDGEKFPLTKKEARSFTCLIPDTFSGKLYGYVEHNTAISWNTFPVLKACYTQTSDQTETTSTLVFASRVSGISNVLKKGGAGNTLTYRISTTDQNGYEIAEDYTIQLLRTPTLSALSVTDQNGTPQAATDKFSPAVNTYTYKILDTVNAVTILPTAAGTNAQGYAVSVNGTPVNEGKGAVVTLKVDDNGAVTDTEALITVTAGDFTNTYRLLLTPSAGKRITFNTTANDVSLTVVNNNGEALAYTKFKQANGYNAYLYNLVPGETYSYVASKDDCYYASKTFTMEESANTTITVNVKAVDWLTDLALGSTASAAGKGSYALDTQFLSSNHRYTAVVPDELASVYAWAAAESGDISASYTMIYSTSLYDGVAANVSLTSGSAKGTRLQRLLLVQNPYSNTVTIRVSQPDENDGVLYYQDYTVELTRTLSLKDITAACNGNTVPLTQKDSETLGFVPSVADYTLTVPSAATKMMLTPKIYTPSASAQNCKYGDDTTGYQVSINGKAWEEGETEVSLSGDNQSETLVLMVTNSLAPTLKSVYTIQVNKAAPVYATVAILPESALLTLHETISGNRIWPQDGEYLLSDGYAYHYTLTQNGYVGRAGALQLTKNEAGDTILILDGDQSSPIPVVRNATDDTMEATISLTLEKAAINNAIDHSITSEWSDFRGTSYTYSAESGLIAGGTTGSNNGVTAAETPITAGDGTLYWATKLGSGYGSEAVGCPILVDNCVVTYSGSSIYKVDTISGKVIATGKMDHNSSFSITPPTYYDGMIFIALSDGTVQAFNADTLESLWVYQDALGGQPNSPMTVYQGYLYTGFWNSEIAEANYVCLSVTDEDPTQTKEQKQVTWHHTQAGGFYWAGAYVCQDYVLVGTDDGNSGYNSKTAMLLMLDPLTGRVMDRLTGLNGDVRSTVTYDEASQTCYFTSKGGSFYSVQPKKQDGVWRLSGLKTLALQNGTESTAMSTSTPVVYNGRAYVGGSGAGQFTAYSGHNITVIDLTDWKIAYRVETQGYPQTSGLLTTAYVESTGSAYIYFFDNYTPGKLRALRDKPGQTAPDYTTTEQSGTTTPYVLFTPTGEQAEYAICSPIVDAYGTIYFKNDSASLMAYGNRIEKIEVTKQPDQTQYRAGETFNPAGMQVIATYSNGMKRDVTNYVTFSQDALTQQDDEITLAFAHILYHNEDNVDGTSTAGVGSVTPTALVKVSVSAAGRLGDVNEDGKVDSTDAALVLRYVAQQSGAAIAVSLADVNGDGIVDSTDASLILRYAAQQITVFPAEEK